MNSKHLSPTPPSSFSLAPSFWLALDLTPLPTTCTWPSPQVRRCPHHHLEKDQSQQTQPHDLIAKHTHHLLYKTHLHCHRMGCKDHSKVGGENPEDSSSAPSKGRAAKADEGVNIIEVTGFVEGVFAFSGGLWGGGVAELLEVFVATTGGGGWSGYIYFVWMDSWSLVMRRSLMLWVAMVGAEELLVEGGLTSMVILVGSGRWVQMVFEVGHNNNYIEN